MEFTQEHFFTIFKFAIVGFSSFLIDMLFTYLLKEKAGLTKYVANTCGLLLAGVYNFTMNRLWTFHSQDKNISVQIVKFSALILFNLFASNALIYLFSERLKCNFYLSKILTIVIITAFNFSVGKLLIFTH